MKKNKKYQNPEEVFSKCIKHLREEHELTQAQLASSIGISRQSINAIEKGRSLPSIELAIDIAEYFDKTIDDLLSFTREFNQITNHIENISNPMLNGNIRKEQSMNQLSPWQNFRDTMSLKEAMDQLFEDSYIPQKSMPSIKLNSVVPSVDMYETDKELVTEVHMPGYSEKDINVEVDEKGIYLSGEKKEEIEDKKKNYFHKEIAYGKFNRVIGYPVKVKSEKAQADFSDGVLKIVIPKMEEKKPKTIKLKISKK